MRNPPRKPGTKASAGITPGTLSGKAFTAARVAALRGVHSHGCVQCSAYYSDACADPLTNATCKDCLDGYVHGRPSWDRSNDPIECCRSQVRLATARQLNSFRLGGDGPWWICAVCNRTHPYDPRVNPPPTKENDHESAG
jgi:hypothetical protein